MKSKCLILNVILLILMMSSIPASSLGDNRIKDNGNNVFVGFKNYSTTYNIDTINNNSISLSTLFFLNVSS